MTVMDVQGKLDTIKPVAGSGHKGTLMHYLAEKMLDLSNKSPAKKHLFFSDWVAVWACPRVCL